MLNVKLIDTCPCCSGMNFGECCQKFVTNRVLPTTPEQLMRSRYTAFFTNNLSYIKNTASGKALLAYHKGDKSDINLLRFVKLELVATSTQGNTGFVEFKAYYIEGGQIKVLHENSKFELIANKWFYVDGEPKN